MTAVGGHYDFTQKHLLIRAIRNLRKININPLCVRVCQLKFALNSIYDDIQSLNGPIWLKVNTRLKFMIPVWFAKMCM